MDSPRSKAVAIGAVLHFLDHTVSSRVARASYGVLCYTGLDPVNPEHRERMDMVHISSLTGNLMIGPLFDCILEKVNL